MSMSSAWSSLRGVKWGETSIVEETEFNKFYIYNRLLKRPQLIGKGVNKNVLTQIKHISGSTQVVYIMFSTTPNTQFFKKIC